MTAVSSDFADLCKRGAIEPSIQARLSPIASAFSRDESKSDHPSADGAFKDF